MSDSDSAAIDARRRRLLFRATHRGTHENDLMIGSFVRAGLREFDDDELNALEALLEFPDTQLADWLTGRRPLPPDAPPMLQRMREAVAQTHLRPVPRTEDEAGGGPDPDQHRLHAPLSPMQVPLPQMQAPLPPTSSGNRRGSGSS